MKRRFLALCAIVLIGAGMVWIRGIHDKISGVSDEERMIRNALGINDITYESFKAKDFKSGYDYFETERKSDLYFGFLRAGKEDGNIGDTLTNQSFSFCVNSVELSNTYNGYPARDDFFFLLAELTVKNDVADKLVEISSSGARMIKMSTIGFIS